MQWLSFSSRRSGTSQIYIRPWPNVPSREIQLSTQGGSDAFWSKDGKELFYRNRNQFMRVTVPDSPSATWMPEPKSMFTGNYLNCFNTSWDIMPDGEHFIMIQPTHPDPPRTELYLIKNWFEELKRLVPIK
jgi:Tol biopolymer transport system component